jgi:hypothetical protein
MSLFKPDVQKRKEKRDLDNLIKALTYERTGRTLECSISWSHKGREQTDRRARRRSNACVEAAGSDLTTVSPAPKGNRPHQATPQVCPHRTPRANFHPFRVGPEGP